jgi:uncharacterized protein YbcI
MASGEHEALRSLAMRISNAMVGAQKKFFGRGPVKAGSYFVDDLLFIVMRGNQTRAEQTMVEEFGQDDKVGDFRQVFENEMAANLTGMIEDMTGRKVLTYQSQILFNPDIVIEIFVVDRPLAERPAFVGRERASTARYVSRLADNHLHWRPRSPPPNPPPASLGQTDPADATQAPPQPRIPREESVSPSFRAGWPTDGAFPQSIYAVHYALYHQNTASAKGGTVAAFADSRQDPQPRNRGAGPRPRRTRDHVPAATPPRAPAG